MKKLALILGLFMLTGIAFTSCKSGAAGDKYTLKMRLNKGDKFSQNIDMDMTTNVKAMGISKEVKMNMLIGADFEVLDSTAAGKQMKITYIKMDTKMDMGMPAQKGMMDSMMNEQSKAIVGKSITVTMSNNKITNVEGMEAVMGTDDSNPAVKAAMEKTFSKENLNSMFGMMLNLYPANPVGIGDSWTAENKMDLSGMEMTVKNNYKLLAVKDGVAEIEVDGTIDTKGPMKQGGMEVDMTMKGTQKGKMNSNISDGYIKNGNYVMDITADMTVMGQKMPMTMKANYKIN